MSNKKNTLKYLSQSVLLEERGIPRLNLWIILIIFFMTISFIAWSMVLQLDETVKLKGLVVESSETDSQFAFKAIIPSEDIGLIREGTSLTITIPGLTTTIPLSGEVKAVDEKFSMDALEDAYFEALVLPEPSSEAYQQIDEKLRQGMKVNFQTVVGHKTLFEYFLGAIIKTKDNALTEKQ